MMVGSKPYDDDAILINEVAAMKLTRCPDQIRVGCQANFRRQCFFGCIDEI